METLERKKRKTRGTGRELLRKRRRGWKKRKKRGEGGNRIVDRFWNVAELRDKCNKVWKYIEKFNIIGFMELWIDEKKWEKRSKNFLKKFN